MKTNHDVLNLIFINSVLDPLVIRTINIAFGISLDLALNAFFFSDDYIEKQAEVKKIEKPGIWYTISNEFWKSVWPIIITAIVVVCTDLIK